MVPAVGECRYGLFHGRIKDIPMAIGINTSPATITAAM